MRGIWGHDEIVRHLGECRQSVAGWVSGDHGGYSHTVMCKIAKASICPARRCWLEVRMRGIWDHDEIVRHLGECRQSVAGWVSGDHGGYSYMVMCKIAKTSICPARRCWLEVHEHVCEGSETMTRLPSKCSRVGYLVTMVATALW